MLRIRMVEEAIASRYHHEEMRCPVHLSIGQEAVAVGVASALDRRDAVLSTHRAHAHYLAKGGDLRAMIAEIHGRATGCSGGMGGSMHLVDMEAGFLGSTPIVGGSIPVGAGVAFASKQRGDGRVTAVFFGDGTTEEGVFYETLNFAALHRLPLVFICEDNLYSVYSPREVRQPAGRDLVALGRSMGLAAERGDGNDVRLVRDLATRAVARARSGDGPTLLELSTYRWLEHCGPNYDNDIGYRSEAEFEVWRERCPVERETARVIAAGEATVASIDATRLRIAAEVDDAFAFALASPFPEDRDLPAAYASPLVNPR
ncbi:MAG: thiamine pyrophosphate-dependent dehydrogenase E1 component subunit alpha [Dehalococcoidia bacterium]|nr:MAG: thiamine pyrophosphate-dependent dehydrogenase E1 component subunit alpha [Dehalococcoidia bacterium]